MISHRLVGVSAGLLLALSSNAGAVDVSSIVEKQIPSPDGIGNPGVFLKNYEAFKSNRLHSGTPELLTIPLGRVNGHRRSFTATAGSIELNLKTGNYRINLNKLTDATIYYVWIVNEGNPVNRADDRVIQIASVIATGSVGSTSGQLEARALEYPIDRIVVTTDQESAQNVLATGSIRVLDKVLLGSNTVTVEGQRVADGGVGSWPLPFGALVPRVSSGGHSSSQVGSTRLTSPPEPAPVDTLIKQGSKLFFEQTFGGNGRTCGTCHPAQNNFTINPAFISKLPSKDPLFVAENNPALAQLEKPALMRAFGLILENLDGFEAPATKFVMRSVQHTLGMTVTTNSFDIDPPLPGLPAQMVGWSGDGAPGSGSLRDFATGAVMQHFTKSLARVEGEDFRLPTQNELDALEAFLLSLGRTADFDLSQITFRDAQVERGKALFINGNDSPRGRGVCMQCHENGGANVFFSIVNDNVDTRVDKRIHPARQIQDFPRDGGFGTTPNTDGTFGDATFNIQSLVEAADTPPFFHNNLAPTLEDAVRHYTSPEFNGIRPLPLRFSFSETEITQIANFLRALNTLQNIDLARRELDQILSSKLATTSEIQSRLAVAYNEAGDVIQVLGESNIFPAAVIQITNARQLILQAQGTITPAQRTSLIKLAGKTLDAARGLVATVGP